MGTIRCEPIRRRKTRRCWGGHYMQLVHIEAAFQCLKSELGICPIYQQLEHRVEAHILVAFLAYQRLEVWFPTTDGRWLSMPR